MERIRIFEVRENASMLEPTTPTRKGREEEGAGEPLPEDDDDEDACKLGNCSASHFLRGSPSATATPTPAEGSI